MKKPLSLLLLEAQNEITALQTANAKLTKDLADTESRRKYASDNAEAARGVVEDLHAMLDMLPTAPPREHKKKPDDYSTVTLSPAARLVGYVASRAA